MASNNTKIGAHDCCCSAGSIAATRKAQGASKKKKTSPPKKIAALWCPSVGRSGGPVFPAVSSAGWRVCYLHTITPPPSRSTTNTAPHICHHSDGVTSSMYCFSFKKRKRDPTKNQRVNHAPPVWACALDPASEKRSRLPTCLLPVLLLLAGSRTTSGFPTVIPALEPTLAVRSTCATKDVTRWFSRWWSGSIVSTPLPRATVALTIQSTYKNRLSCGVAPFSFKSTREGSKVVVSVMAYHLPAWPPVGTTGASLMAFSSTVAAWFFAIAHFGATVAGQSVMGLRPCSTSQCWLNIPMWSLNLQLRRIAIQKWRQ